MMKRQEFREKAEEIGFVKYRWSAEDSWEWQCQTVSGSCERARCDQTTDRKRVCSAAKDSGVLLGITNEKLRPPFVLTILDLFLQRITVSPNISYLNIPRHSHISEKWRSHRFDSEDLWWPTVTYGFVSQFERSCRICRRMVEHGRNLDGPWIDGAPDQDRSR